MLKQYPKIPDYFYKKSLWVSPKAFGLDAFHLLWGAIVSVFYLPFIY